MMILNTKFTTIPKILTVLILSLSSLVSAQENTTDSCAELERQYYNISNEIVKSVIKHSISKDNKSVTVSLDSINSHAQSKLSSIRETIVSECQIDEKMNMKDLVSHVDTLRILGVESLEEINDRDRALYESSEYDEMNSLEVMWYKIIN